MDLIEQYHFYINLSKHESKNKQTSNELKKFGIDIPSRFNGINHKTGAVGCIKSHIKCIELAKQRNYPFVCIFEDDIVFREIDKCKEMISKYINYNYDVLYLGCKIFDNNYKFITDDLIHIKKAECNHAYIIKSHYYDKLLENYNESLNYKLKDLENIEYNLDRYINILQKNDKWYSFYPNFVSQKSGYSDVYNTEINLHDDIFHIPIHDSKLPTVSLLTPTFNRKIFLDLMIHNIKGFKYPKEKIEWCILESNDKNLKNYQKLFDEEPKDLEKKLGIKINYVYADKSFKIGEKRNILCASSKNAFLINMDDDDIYLPEYINHSIDILINQKKDITSCLDMLFVYPQNEFKTSYIKCVQDYKLYHEATMCMKKSHWMKYKYDISSKGEGISVYGDESVCGISQVIKCMVCVCWNGNTVNKNMFLNYPINMNINGECMIILKSIFNILKNNSGDQNIQLIKNKQETEEIMISRELLKNIRRLIENTSERIHWKIDEMLPVGLIVNEIDKLLMINSSNLPC